MEAEELVKYVRAAGYSCMFTKEYSLPNGIKLLQIDFKVIEDGLHD